MPAVHLSCREHCDCEPPNSVEEAHAKLERLTVDSGFERFAFGFRTDALHLDPSPLIITNFPEEWRDRYVQRHYALVDPIRITASRSVRPFLWDQGSFLRGFRKQQRRVVEEMGAFGLNAGLAIPVHGAGGELALLVVASSDGRRLPDGECSVPQPLLAAAVGTFEFALANKSSLSGASEFELTVRERECLIWTAEGKTALEISDLLNLSVFTVNRHISTAVRKLGCANKTHAACKALAAKLIRIA